MPRGFSGLLAGLVLIACAGVSLADDLTPERQRQLRDLLVQDCGSCHGLTMGGGLGPALTPEALRGKSDELLVAVVLKGRPGTPMPPWDTMLTEQEVRWMVKLLRVGVSQ